MEGSFGDSGDLKKKKVGPAPVGSRDGPGAVVDKSSYA